jgi:diamine N-acetyltransferase
MSNLYVRRVQYNDEQAIAQVAMRAWTHTYKDIYPKEIITKFVSEAYSLQRLITSIEKDMQRTNSQFVVATDSEQKVQAFAQIVKLPNEDGTSYELNRIYAAPEVQGSGVGKSMLNYLLHSVNEIKSLYAWVAKENKIGKKFYESSGFKMVNQKTDEFYGFSKILVQYKLSR